MFDLETADTTPDDTAELPAAANGEVSTVPARDSLRRVEGRSIGGLTIGLPVAESGARAATVHQRDCSPRESGSFVVSDPSPAPASIEMSQALYVCAHEVGLALASDHSAIAALVTRGLQGPLLLSAGSELSAVLVDEVRRLHPERIVAAGIDEGLVGNRLPAFEVEHLAVDEAAVLLPERASFERVWLVDAAQQVDALAAVARQIGVGVVPVAGDLRGLAPWAREAISGASEVELLSEFGEDARWQLEVVRRGDELPGGGLLMFEPGAESPGRRLVAAYGHPTTSVLGVLGEQSAEEGIERLRSIAEGYGADGSIVVPTFEIIATVASASPSADGDYSGVTSRDVIRPWVEAAAANGAYVVLDLQPGRSDFLSQARIYEEFLRQPHVGLALDPEWRLKPHQFHLAQIGTVDAAEINEVVEWLASIVREDALPQKLLVVHQFRFSMITNRDQIATPPELAVLIQMDGQGTLTAKHDTWNALTGKQDADRFYWGWKNFYDEDSPMATPGQVLALSPPPVFVSFQ
ncbi:MAG: hypothetical protein F4Z34_07570 [Acidimicrobiaceae bacterium]|nr:hypothetical protein [Acidimicrobiaceae bacterium]